MWCVLSPIARCRRGCIRGDAAGGPDDACPELPASEQLGPGSEELEHLPCGLRSAVPGAKFPQLPSEDDVASEVLPERITHHLRPALRRGPYDASLPEGSYSASLPEVQTPSAPVVGCLAPPSPSAPVAGAPPQSAVEVERALSEATRLMEDTNVLDAEDVLGQTLERLLSGNSPGGEAEARKVRTSPVFEDVCVRCAQYSRLGQRVLGGFGALEKLPGASQGGFDLVWERPDAKLWLKRVPDQTWADVKLAIDIDAPLSQCMVPAHELDLQPLWNKHLISPPKPLGTRRRFKLVTHSQISVLMLRLEAIFEVIRICNKQFGFLAECIRSDFPAEGFTIPGRSWRNSRVTVDTSNMWIPRGGSSRGTLLVQVTRIDFGFHIPERVAKALLSKVAPGIVDNLITSATRAKEPGSIWQERLQKDADGLYGELRKVEEIARRRSEVSTESLPSLDVFRRKHQLSTGAACEEGTTIAEP